MGPAGPLGPPWTTFGQLADDASANWHAPPGATVTAMAQGTPNGRAAGIATASALGATALAGLASVVVQFGGAAAYAVFAVLIIAVLALVATAGYWIRRAAGRG
jgi:hypothetical protein